MHESIAESASGTFALRLESRPQGGGLALVDKAPGVSSFQALWPLKRVHRGLKVGHAGTLDPDASGLLLAGVDRATRMLQYVEALPKEYRFAVRLGVSTDTYDMQGTVLERKDPSGVSPEAVREALKRFRGGIEQMPPAYSAIKIAGKRACDRARAGESIILKSRMVTVHSLELEDFSGGILRLRLVCSRGTYVRALAHDIGNALGVGGAAEAIRRLAIGPFRVEQAVAHDDVEGLARLVPLGEALNFLPAIRVPPAKVGALRNGNALRQGEYRLPIPATGNASGPYRILSVSEQLLAVGRILSDGALCPEKVLTGA